MSLTQNILRSYRDPAGVVRGLAQGDLREPQVMFFALAGLRPDFRGAMARPVAGGASIDPSVTFEQRMGGAMFGIMFLLPLILYGLRGCCSWGCASAGLPCRASWCVWRCSGRC